MMSGSHEVDKMWEVKCKDTVICNNPLLLSLLHSPCKVYHANHEIAVAYNGKAY